MSLNSGITFEAFIYSNIPLKCNYEITYRVDYGRSEIKWSEMADKSLFKS